jgi:hypothetical protein
MIFGLLLLATALTPPSCVPSRWPLSDPASLALLDPAPLNCILLEPGQTNRAMVDALHQRQRQAYAVVISTAEAEQAAAVAVDGLVVEGLSDTSALRAVAAKHHLACIELPARAAIDLDTQAPVTGTVQGVWPGFHEVAPDTIIAGPTAQSWLDTNTGFLRYLAARLKSGTAVWMANRPPAREPVPADFQRALCDMALTGAQWVFAPGPELVRQAAAGDAAALVKWNKLMRLIAFYRDQRALIAQPAQSTLGVVLDVGSGALLSGGLAAQFAAKLIPFVTLPPEHLTTAPRGFHTLVAVNTADLSATARDNLKAAQSAGARLYLAPDNMRIEAPRNGPYTFDQRAAAKLDGLWSEINAQVGRANYGARLFNASGLLANVVGRAGGNTAVIHIVNFTDYPVTDLTVAVPYKPKRARWLTPAGERKPSDQFEIEEGTAIMLDQVDDAGLLVVER